jgi:drug/metabolite transporter (DMT)-like permease
MTTKTAGDRPIDLATALFVSALFVVWGGNVVAIKVGLAGLPPLGMAALRFLLAALVLAAWMRAQGIPFRPENRQEVLHHVLNGVAFATQIALFYMGVKFTSASHASVLINSNPFFVLLLAHFFVEGDRLTGPKLTGLSLAFVGVVFLFAEQLSGGGWMGNALVVLSAALLGGRIVYVKRLIATIEPSHVVFWQMVVGVPLFLLGNVAVEAGRPWVFSLPIVLAVLFQGIVIGGFCFLASTILLQRHNPSALSVFSFIIPLSGVALSHLILGDPLTANLLTSASLVALGIILVHRAPVARPTALSPGHQEVEIPPAEPYH